MTDHQPMPVQGYTAQSQEKIDLVNEGKALEERMLRFLEKVETMPFSNDSQRRALALGKTYLQTGYMWTFRAVFDPQRAKLPEDAA